MASIRKKRDGYEIRECLSTKKGPRQFTLASFHGVLTPEILDRAEEKARLPFDREKLVARARKLGVTVSERRRFPEARALLAVLRRGGRLSPRLVGLLKSALEPLAAEPVPEHLEDAAFWLGQPENERGKALRDLMRSADRVLQSRAPLRTRSRELFPHFHSRAADLEEQAG